MEVKTFREAYGVLQEHAQTLREQTEPNIDDLLSIVTESVAAYKVCKERIDAVEKALQEALTDVGSEMGRTETGTTGDDDDAPSAPAARRASSRPAPQSSVRGVADTDDDVPF